MSTTGSNARLEQKTSMIEFIALMALLTSIEALSIDAMLPALSQIGQSLNAVGNQPQLIIGAIFLGGCLWAAYQRCVIR